MNIIPEKKDGRILNYYCTFSRQGRISLTYPEWKGTDARDAITYDLLFNENDGILTTIAPEIRGDLLVVLDDGWDVPHGQKHDYENDAGFGSCIPNAGKFPELSHLEGKYRLKALVDKIESLGYAGVGLWVPSHHFNEDINKNYGERQTECIAIWEEVGKMLAYAGVKYLKVDWGYHGRDVIYRRNMNKGVKKFAPDVVMEHVIGIYRGPYDLPIEEIRDTDEYKNFMETGRKTIAISDVYRTYDTTEDFADVTTLMRLSELFDLKAETDTSLLGELNIEDSAVMAAALGMNMGLMRHVLTLGKGNEDEFITALKWQRIAPAFRLDSVENRHSDDFLTDDKHYEADPLVWWRKDKGADVVQSAPSVLSRNAPLAEVVPDADGNKPFVVSSLNPVTDAYTVAALPRIVDSEKKHFACDVCVKGAKMCGKLGVFGAFNSLVVEFDGDISGCRVISQNLLCGDAEDVTESVEIKGNVLKIPGKIICGNMAFEISAK